LKGQVSDVGRFKDYLLSVEVKFSELTGFLETWVIAFRAGIKVGHAIFCDESASLYPLSIMLDDDVQRQGLGTAMYVWAERVRTMTIIPSRDQKPLGRLFWAQPERPFGNPQK
jgi:hypothetical protein